MKAGADTGRPPSHLLSATSQAGLWVLGLGSDFDHGHNYDYMMYDRLRLETTDSDCHRRATDP